MRALRTLSTMIGLAAVVAATAAVPPIASAEPAAGAQLVAIGDSFMAAGSNAAATRSVDPVELEKLRMEQMTRGFSPGQNRQGGDELFAESLFDSVAYVSFQELATRVSHRNTGVACAEPIAQELLKHISNDENLHMIFYRNMVEAGLEIAPNQAVKSIHKVLDNFTMPGYTIPGFRRNAVTIATGGVYDPQLHLAEVVQPVLRKWRIFERDDINGEGEWYREDLDRIITDLKKTASDFDEVKAKYLERQAKRAERQAAKV
ncbi:Probable acyl-[acyl-carrier protein] desaturase DesA1 [Mycobacteroides abscessus subsp. abscessus]|nr:Probable acyl-[acyl-carrier protein] desaturase DesA1 [Mycobacteroides abscessus subsp. abscessus]